MKRKRRLLIALVMVFSLSMVSFADVVLEKIQAHWAHDIKFQVDGKPWEPKELDGSRLSPILYKGRTYLPARALLEEKDVAVAFNEESRTIHLDYPLWEPPPQDIPKAPEYEPPLGKKSSPYYIQKSDIGGPYKEILNYDILFELLDQLEGPPTTTTMEMELADDAIFMLNGKEIDLDRVVPDLASYYFIIDPKDKISLSLDSKTKAIKQASIDLEERKPSDEEVGRTKVIRSMGNSNKLTITIEPQEEVYYGTVVWRPKK